jgi:hypothetical protein
MGSEVEAGAEWRIGLGHQGLGIPSLPKQKRARLFKKQKSSIENENYRRPAAELKKLAYVIGISSGHGGMCCHRRSKLNG